ncbi:MAG: hypothetical protein JNM80_11730 [Phycisphaerae bacterium]|nr:hypothetical protein [Phycisphaerae bacterium]
MASAKSGSAGSLVAPSEPPEALEAADDRAGAMDEPGSGGGSRDPDRPAPGSPTPTPGEDPPPGELTWIEIELVDENDKPVAGARYSLIMPDGSPDGGTLDEAGFARREGLKPGTCWVSFPEYDGGSWRKI